VALRLWADRALLSLFDPTCAACRAPLDDHRRGPVCGACWASIRPLPSSLVAGDARAIGLHEGPLRDIIHAFKYRGQASLAAPLGALMREAAGDWLEDVIVVPVPLHPWRSWRRGFNQADLLACTLGPPVRRLLRRRRLGRPQAGLHADERRANVSGVYTMARRQARRVPDRVLLVDDVMTTGATVDACARVLKQAGVRQVLVLTASRAPQPRAASFGSTAASMAARTSSLPISPSIRTQPDSCA
jgi:ComF family protein